MQNNRIIIVGTIAIACITSILADVEKPMDFNDAELEMLLKKSEEQLVRVTIIAKKVDKMSVEHQEQMMEQIEVLEEKNENLEVMVEQVQEAYHEMVVKYDSAPTKQFDIFAILSDSTNRG